MIDGIGRGAPPQLPKLGGEAIARTTIARLSPNPMAPTTRAPGAGGGIVREMAAKPPVDTARVEALRLAINSGTYKPDPRAIAAKMVSLEQGTRKA